jgi:hypothetical protein
MAKARKAKDTASFLLKPADPFDLIRWLARSQSDPRKAVAELVQNSLDAGAREVTIKRQRIRKAVCLVVHDDGQGVLPEMGREEALRYLATHVGHSRKMQLDPAERARQVVAGKYGVGLLGFWSIGKRMEVRSRVNGSGIFALRLEEDSPHASIVALPPRTDSAETFTEIVVEEVHETAQKALSGRRLSDYLAAELRGQLLRREVSVRVQDHIARGLAQQSFEVTPRRFTGERLALPPEIPVPSFTALRVELYLARGAERPAVQVACAGTLVADDIAELSALGLAVAPWVGHELTGILDFPDFSVPPGTRRGVAPDRAALAFVVALDSLSVLVNAELKRLDTERRATLDRDVVRDLKRALRGFRRRLPQYDLPRVEGREERPAAPEDGAALPDEPERDATPPEKPFLFPPGPLHAVRIVPSTVRVAPGGERRVRAVPTDADDRVLDGVDVSWSIADAPASLSVRGEGVRPAVAARSDAQIGAQAELRVEARQGDRTATGAATLMVAEADEDDGSAIGVPEPHLVSDADGTWRSRMAGDRWEVNDAHDDYRAFRGEPRARVRYLLTLLAKEIVLRTSGRPETADVLESVVEVLAHAERNLRGG